MSKVDCNAHCSLPRFDSRPYWNGIITNSHVIDMNWPKERIDAFLSASCCARFCFSFQISKNEISHGTREFVHYDRSHKCQVASTFALLCNVTKVAVTLHTVVIELERARWPRTAVGTRWRLWRLRWANERVAIWAMKATTSNRNVNVRCFHSTNIVFFSLMSSKYLIETRTEYNSHLALTQNGKARK